MRTRIIAFLLFVCAAVLAPDAWTESTFCQTPVLIVPDGRITQSKLAATTTYWYGIYATAGHSYSIEFVPTADNFLTASTPQFAPLVVIGPIDPPSCGGTPPVAVTDTSGYAPMILKKANGYQNGAGRRNSFTAQSAGLYLIAVTNGAGAGNYTFRAVDTTLMNPRWSTCGGFGDQWGLMNLSDMLITGILSVYDYSGRTLAVVPLKIPVGGLVGHSSDPSDLNLPRNSSGFVIFSHNGPPGSILADSYMISPGSTIIVPTKFETFPRQ